eukprot:3042660-Alexandrium_andersonii.AAC.1
MPAFADSEPIRSRGEGRLARWACWGRGPPRAGFWAPSSESSQAGAAGGFQKSAPPQWPNMRR